MWEDVVVDLITKKLPKSEEVAGIRICDKSRGGDAQIRIEVWTKIKSTTDEGLIEMKAHIKALFTNHGFITEIQIADRK